MKRRVMRGMAVAVAVAALTGCATMQRQREMARLKVAHLNMANLNIALALYYSDTGRYPSEQEGLQALLRPASGASPYITNIPTDPWGRPYRYRLVDNFPQIDSAGADGIFGTADDVHE